MLRKHLINFFFIALTFFLSKAIYSQKTIISKGDIILYYDKGDLPNNWYINPFIYKGWQKGSTPIGYGDRLVNFKIKYGKNENNKDITKYFVKTFKLDSLDTFAGFKFTFLRDDGIVVYLNGEEVFRNNMPKNTTITAKTLALDLIDRDKESTVHSRIIPLKYFNKDKNTFAISVHQYNKASSDSFLSFDLLGYKDINTLISETKQISTINSHIQEQQLKKQELLKDYKNEKLALELSFLRNSNDNLKFIVFTIIFLLIITVFAAFFILINQNKKLSKNQQDIVQLEKEKNDTEKEMLITSTKLLQNKQWLKELKADLKCIDTKDVKIVNNMLKQIDESINQENNFKQLEAHFNAVFNGFYDKLSAKHSDLTETELRHCLLIKMHLQTKEIANILLIDPRSVQTSRYRIKKKMKLDENTDLKTYLFTI